MSAKSVRVGARFGKLKAICLAKDKRNSWVCKCDCGGEDVIYGSHLSRGSRTSCNGPGCQPTKDYTGKRCGLLTAVSRAPAESRNERAWLHRCVCGNEVILTVGQMNRREKRSCGCTPEDQIRHAHTLPNQQGIRNKAYGQHLAAAKLRGYAADLTQEQYETIASQPCYYCGGVSQRTRRFRTSPKEALHFNSVDRLNNEPYYRLENSVPCCFVCQKMKGALTEREFLDQVRKVVLHLRA